MSHFYDILSRQSLGLVLKEQNLKQKSKQHLNKIAKKTKNKPKSKENLNQHSSSKNCL